MFSRNAYVLSRFESPFPYTHPYAFVMTPLSRVSCLIKLLASTCNFTKKETLAKIFSCEFCEILRAPFLQNTSGRLLLSN